MPRRPTASRCEVLRSLQGGAPLYYLTAIARLAQIRAPPRRPSKILVTFQGSSEVLGTTSSRSQESTDRPVLDMIPGTVTGIASAGMHAKAGRASAASLAPQPSPSIVPDDQKDSDRPGQDRVHDAEGQIERERD